MLASFHWSVSRSAIACCDRVRIRRDKPCARPLEEDVMNHGPAQDSGPDPASIYKTRLGVLMFVIYCLVYAGFVLLNVVTEGAVMQTIVFAGLNLAVVYGLGLIVFALLLALLYNHLCTRKEAELAGASSDTEGGA
jgi:uncharacterized membrane protein (DUF485 family)